MLKTGRLCVRLADRGDALNFDVRDVRFAARVFTMIEAQLISFKHYYCWADEVISTLDDPPSWVCEISTIKYIGDALQAISSFLRSQPNSAVNGADDDYIACLLLRHQIGAISWATFLYEAGRYSDSSGCRWDCEEFYHRLNQLEDCEFAKTCEATQLVEILAEFAKEFEIISELYNYFLPYFRRFVTEHPGRCEARD
jgi:hypothetical protein